MLIFLFIVLLLLLFLLAVILSVDVFLFVVFLTLCSFTWLVLSSLIAIFLLCLALCFFVIDLLISVAFSFAFWGLYTVAILVVIGNFVFFSLLLFVSFIPRWGIVLRRRNVLTLLRVVKLIDGPLQEVTIASVS